MKVPKVGDIVSYWFAPNGTRVLKVVKYTGNYPEFFKAWVRLVSDTPRGYIEVAW